MLQSRLKLDTLYLTHYSSICTNLSKIAKKLNIDLCQFFSHWKEALFLLKPWNKNGSHRTRFCSRAAESVHQMHFLRVLREDWGEFQNGMYMEGWGGGGGAKVQYPLSRFSISRSNSATNSALHYAHSQHIESHLCKKQPQAKIPIAFLFNQLHLLVLLQMVFFTVAILLCAVRDVQCKTGESP